MAKEVAAAVGAVMVALGFILAQEQAAAAVTRMEMEFYMHDNFNIEPNSVIQVAGTKNASNPFGDVMVIDDPLTEGPLLTSKLVGRGQGTYMSSALDGSSLLLTFTAVFSTGDHNGSTISFHGADRLLLRQREIAVIGGTGKYKMARGYAVMETISNTINSTILQFNVTVDV